MPVILLPLVKLVDLFGPKLADTATALEVGHAAAPELINNSWQIVYLRDRLDTVPPELADVKDLVLVEMRRRETESLLRQSLTRMRDTQDIVISKALP